MSYQFAQAILAQVKNLVNKRLYKSFQILLNPCCDITINSIDVECDEDSNYTLTITTNEAIGFLNKGVATVKVDNVAYTGVITEPKTITVEAVDVTPDTYNVVVTLELPVNDSVNIGVYKTLDTEEVVFPSCA